MNRREFGETYMFCFLCGYSRPSGEHLQTHEMCSGPMRARALKEPATWLCLCDDFAHGCHTLLQGIGRDGVALMAIPLALKLMHDPEHYDLAAVNRIGGGAKNQTTQAEVEAMVRRLEKHIGGRRTLSREAARRLSKTCEILCPRPDSTGKPST